MDFLTSFIAIFLTYATFFHLNHFLKSKILRRSSTPLPPGPPPLPVIGNILSMRKSPHQSLADLSKTFGPLMALKLGSVTTIAISSPEIAKQALQKHDKAFSGRPILDAVRSLDHHRFSVAWLPASDQWRNLRKIVTGQLFTVQKLDSGENLRRRKVRELLDFMRENCESGEAVDVGQAAFTTVLNILSNTLFSIDLAAYNSEKSQEFYDLVLGTLEESAKPNLGDYFPVLKAVDLQGIRRKTELYFRRLFEVFNGIITERMQSKSSAATVNESEDVLDFLLDSGLSIVEIKHLLLDLFVAGTDTTAKTLEWGMAELIRNPEKQSKLKNELKELNKTEIQESDIEKLPYLQSTVKEILRLHPPAPFLVPHKAEHEVEIGGFKIPKDAQILVNVWAIGRDEVIWENPSEFEPERFMGNNIDVKGRDFELIPFGAGRRVCPGLALAQRMLHLMLASLVNSFNWKLAGGVKSNQMDMTEGFGLAIFKAQPLLAIPCRYVTYV